MMGQSEQDKIRRYLAILGVDESASKKELKKAYHAKVARLHPDLHPDDPQAAKAFKKVNAAYEYLKKNMKKPAPPPPPEKSIAPVPPENKKFAAPPSPSAAAPAAPVITMDELVFRLRNSGNEYLRMHAVKAIATTGGREAVWALLPALDDASPRVTASAIEALGKMNARLAAAPLARLYVRAPLSLRPAIIEALEKIDSPIAARFLSGNFLSSRKPARPATPDLSRIANDLFNA